MTVVRGFRLVRLAWAALAVMSVTVITTLVTVAVYEQAAATEREALIEFACTAVEIQTHAATPVAAEYRDQFNAILDRMGEDPCTTTRREP